MVTNETIKLVLLIFFLAVMVVMVVLIGVATYEAVKGAPSDRHWEFVDYTWHGVLFGISGAIVFYARHIFGQDLRHLAKDVACKWAEDVVRRFDGDTDNLNAEYNIEKDFMKSHFRMQGKRFVKELLVQFREEILCAARRIFPQDLKLWKPIDQDISSGAYDA